MSAAFKVWVRLQQDSNTLLVVDKSQHLGFSPHDHTFKIRVILQQNSISITLLVMSESQHPGFQSLLPNNLTHFKGKCQASGFATVPKYSSLFPKSVLTSKLPDEDRKGDPQLFSNNTILWGVFTFTVLSEENSTTPKLSMARVTFKTNTKLNAGGAENSTFLY